MTRTQTALLWASLILLAAVIMSALNAGDAASFAVTAGLSGSAWAALNLGKGCAEGCLQ